MPSKRWSRGRAQGRTSKCSRGVLGRVGRLGGIRRPVRFSSQKTDRISPNESAFTSEGFSAFGDRTRYGQKTGSRVGGSITDPRREVRGRGDTPLGRRN